MRAESKADYGDYRAPHNPEFVRHVGEKRRIEALIVTRIEREAAKHNPVIAGLIKRIETGRSQWLRDRAKWESERCDYENIKANLRPWGDLRPTHVTKMDIIINRACRVFRVSKVELKSARRSQFLVLARQFVMYWTCRLTMLSLPMIGKRLGDKDHTTVMHGRDSYPIKRVRDGRTLRKIK